VSVIDELARLGLPAGEAPGKLLVTVAGAEVEVRLETSDADVIVQAELVLTGPDQSLRQALVASQVAREPSLGGLYDLIHETAKSVVGLARALTPDLQPLAAVAAEAEAQGPPPSRVRRAPPPPETGLPPPEPATMTVGPAPPPRWSPSHVVPAGGLPTWAVPDARYPPNNQLGPGLQVQVLQLAGAWAEVVCSNGWSAWVDGRMLVPRRR